MSSSIKIFILVVISSISVLATGFVDPIPQNPQYHQFADQRIYFNIPNTLNVVSNLFFALIGVAGLTGLWKGRSLTVINSISVVYATFFISLVAIAPGSAYYHWIPGNQSLVWDRLPISLAFMSFFTITLAERLSLKFAKIMFLPLLLLGALSIVYWHFSELRNNGDLRPYGLVQYLPMLLIPLILLMFKAKFTRDRLIWWFLAWYLIAKVLELFDQQIYEWIPLISGHSLKHLAASIGCMIYLKYLQNRKTIK